MIQNESTRVSTPSVFYVGNFRFPNGDAGAHRVLNVGKCLRDANYSVTFFGAEQVARMEDIQKDGTYAYNAFSYVPAGHAGRGAPVRAARLLYDHLCGFSVMSRLRRARREAAVAIIAYQASAMLLGKLRSFCRRNRMALLADSVEWYDPSHVWGGRFGPFALDNELRMRWMQAKADGVLAISSYLEGYYRDCGRKVLRVPALVDLEDPLWKAGPRTSLCNGSALRLGFVGLAGKKDYLVNAIRGLRLAGNAAKDVSITIVGPSRDEVALSLGADALSLEVLGSRLKFAGRLPHSEALHTLASTDFSILLRPNFRYAQAGFPTKLVESLAMGVPVICNLTGDIGMYVRDGQEGIVVGDSSPESFAEGLKRALAMTDEQRVAMRERAKHQAEHSFDYRYWVEPLRNFMMKVCAQRGAVQGR